MNVYFLVRDVRNRHLSVPIWELWRLRASLRISVCFFSIYYLKKKKLHVSDAATLALLTAYELHNNVEGFILNVNQHNSSSTDANLRATSDLQHNWKPYYTQV